MISWFIAVSIPDGAENIRPRAALHDVVSGRQAESVDALIKTARMRVVKMAT
jgi:hypothetical protein